MMKSPEASDSKKQQEQINTKISRLVNDTSLDGAHNWATTISQYLLQRCQETKSAYQSQLIPNMCSKNEDNQDWLFDALFEVLIQRLEEGHTVLELNVSASNLSHDINSHNELYLWQQQLLSPLLYSLWSVLSTTAVADLTVEELLENDQIWQAAISQSLLSEYDISILDKRRNTAIKLYRYFKTAILSSITEYNSLSNFYLKINKKDLINNERKKPIKTQLEEKNQKITLWLHRNWQAEHALTKRINNIKNQKIKKLPITLNPLLNEEQQKAIHMANNSAFSIITGGPGTGKTFTVAQLVIALQQNKLTDPNSKENLALAAPTGKAAQRMQESLQNAIKQANISIQLPEAKTIHRLLGIGQGGAPRYHLDNPLNEDIIIIDEASMLGVELANHLVNAIKPNARLILLGDANQLAAVDAGAVLADLCRIPTLQNFHQSLQVSRRFTAQSGIGKLASLINQKSININDAWTLMQEEQSLNHYQLTNNLSENIKTHSTAIKSNPINSAEMLQKMLNNYSDYIEKSREILLNTKKSKNTSLIECFNELMTLFNGYKILTAGHHGRCGDHNINKYLSEQHKNELKLPLSKSLWYHGRPIMVLQNNYELGLFNGDIGICLQTKNGQLQVFFENKKQSIAINMFSDDMVATAYAMTIHKSQGSEFERIAVSFDDSNARLLSKELIYTAITRAKQEVTIFSTNSSLITALSTPTVRRTGLALHFENLEQDQILKKNSA